MRLAIHSTASGLSPSNIGSCNNSSAVPFSRAGCMGVFLSGSHGLADEVEANRALANAVGYAPHRAFTNVADGEHARNTGFQKVRVALELPTGGALSSIDEVGTGEQEAFTIPS